MLHHLLLHQRSYRNFECSLAAKAADIPSILITNFTFDSVYSYLSTQRLDIEETTSHLLPTAFNHLVPDVPVPLEELEPLVNQLYAGYKCANLLVLLPGSIPIPSFFKYPKLPSSDWVDLTTNAFHAEVVERLAQPLESSLPDSPSAATLNNVARSAMHGPLLVRHPSTNPSPYSSGGRSKILSSIGIPEHLHDSQKTKVLVVSFGGQVFHAPSRPGSGSASRASSPCRRDDKSLDGRYALSSTRCGFSQYPNHDKSRLGNEDDAHVAVPVPQSPHLHLPANFNDLPDISVPRHRDFFPAPIHTSPRLATPSHIYIPGAPPASLSPTLSSSVVAPFTTQTIPPTPSPTSKTFNPTYFDAAVEPDVQLLPDDSWIAIVCGVSKDQWDRDQDGLPDNFFVAPKEIYMPDLTAVADVLLGKLVRVVPPL
jgi:hypothetical protein